MHHISCEQFSCLYNNENFKTVNICTIRQRQTASRPTGLGTDRTLSLSSKVAISLQEINTTVFPFIFYGDTLPAFADYIAFQVR